MKFIHILIAGLIVGGHFSYIFFKLEEHKLNFNKFVLISLIIQLFSGYYLLNEAGFDLYEEWIFGSLIILITNIFISVFIVINKNKNGKKTKNYNILMFLLLILAIFLMVFKPEFD